MSKRKAFMLRISPETYESIEKWADDEFRSVNGQIEWMLHKCLKDAKRLESKTKRKDEPDKKLDGDGSD